MTTQSRPIFNNFNAGEISPLMSGRMDFPRYKNGVATLENWILHVQGGVTRRWGTKYVGEVKTSSRKTRIIPFEFGGDQHLLIEMGHLYLRFWKNDSRILEPTAELVTNGTFDAGISSWTDPAWPYSHPPSWNSTLQSLQLNGFVGTPPNDTGASAASQAITTEIGKTYRLSWTADTASHGFYIGTTLGGNEVSSGYGTAGSNSTTFVATATTTYITLFGIWVVTNVDDVSVIDYTGTILEIVTTYVEADLFEIQFVQSNDVIYFAHSNYPVKKLVRLAATNDSWDFKTVVFLPPPSFEKEQYPNVTLAPVEAVTGTGIHFYAGDDYFLAADKDKVIQIGDSKGVITAVDAGNQEVTVDIIDDWASSYHQAGGTSNLSSVGTAVTVVGHGLTSANIGDVILLTSGPQSGERRRIDAVPTVDTITIDSAFTVDQTSQSWERGVHMDAQAWRFIGSPSAKLTADKTGPDRAIVTLTLDAAGWRNVDATHSWDKSDVGRYVKAMGGLIKITEITSTTVAKGQILRTLASAPSSPYETLAGTWTIEEDSWSDSTGYPASVCFHEQRLFFGGTDTHPQTLWGSVTNDYENFATGPQATDSVEYTIATNDINPIRWLASARVLLIGTSAREFRASGGQGTISPTNIDIRAETSYGSPKRRPVSIGHTTIFVQRALRRIREMVFSFDVDAYQATDLTVIAPHISAGGVGDIAFCPEPYAVLYAIRGDGQLLSLAYEKDQDVFGWGRIITDGLFESISVLPPVTGGDEYRVYFVVNRTINGSTKRYIERFDSSLHTDCAVIGSGPITTVTGLSHLEGKVVKMKGDGALYPDKTVASGQASFSESVDSYEIGLAYISTLVTNRPEVETQQGSVQGKPKRWSNLYVRCLDTIGLKVNGDQIGTYDPADLMGQAVDPESGDFRADTLGIDGDAQITIQQDLPFPATVVMIAGELVVGD